MSAPAAAQPYKGALPKPTPETLRFWQGAREDKLMLPWCEDCGQAHFYPRALCPHCHGTRLVWREASGRGSIYSYAISHKPAKGFEDKTPYVIAVVALEEGPRMLANLWLDEKPTPENVRIDMKVQAVFDAVTPDITLINFRPAGSQS